MPSRGHGEQENHLDGEKEEQEERGGKHAESIHEKLRHECGGTLEDPQEEAEGEERNDGETSEEGPIFVETRGP